MPKKTRKPRLPDPNELAFSIVQAISGEPSTQPRKPSPRAMAGHLGGIKGGKSRADKLTSSERSSIAKKAAKTRWNNQSKDAAKTRTT